MPAPPPSPSGPSGQRTLAAIVFTDVVGFSARMRQDEERTLRLLQQDFEEMRKVCEAHEGHVLKTTGDGLLMRFSSAVHAVACALAMQRAFAAGARSGAEVEALRHRVGIHLGDVLVQNDDVMGDGVNIAARLQAEAEPGGICISQTVYDVVKNKLELHVLSIGPRELKNISEAIPVYRLMMETPAANAAAGKAPAPPPARSDGRRAAQWAIVAMAVASIAAVFALFQHKRAPSPGVEKTEASPAAGASAPSSPTASAAIAGKDGGTNAKPTASPPARTEPADDDFDRELAARMETIQQYRTRYLEKYDFDGLARALRAKPDGIAQMPLMIRNVEQMGAAKDWLMVSLRKFGRMRPLTVSVAEKGSGKELKVFFSTDRRLVIVDGNATRTQALDELPPETLGAIFVAALRQVKPMASREAFLGAVVFSKVFNLPAMQETLQQMRSRVESFRKK